MPEWLQITRGEAPLIVSMPHTGIMIPPEIEERLASPWRARKDTDWHVEKLYDFAPSMGATIIRTMVSRTVIDVNRDPSGASLYPGQATTELCPTTTFDGEPLYKDQCELDTEEIPARTALYFDPYHVALAEEIDRLRKRHSKIVLFEAHSIRSVIPRLFDGELPNFNIGTNSGASCDVTLMEGLDLVWGSTEFSSIANGRFKGGWTTRHYGKPSEGVHAIQLELACRSYMDEPRDVSPDSWPTPYNEERAAEMRGTLETILEICLAFAEDS